MGPPARRYAMALDVPVARTVASGEVRPPGEPQPVDGTGQVMKPALVAAARAFMGLPGALHCGARVEDAVATTYDHAVIRSAI